jgi:hypothetical protein
MKNTVFGNVMPCSLVEFNRCSSETSVNFYQANSAISKLVIDTVGTQGEHTLYSNRKKLFEFAVANELRFINTFLGIRMYININWLLEEVLQ